jgi:hypothetical protein
MAESFPKETPKAAQALADYVAMGPGRSLSKLAAQYVIQNRYKTKATARSILEQWSIKYQWQARIAEAITERTMALLSEAAELDAETFLAISQEYRRRTKGVMAEASKLDDLHPVRDRVKPVSARVGITVNVTIQREAERLAAELGIPAADLLREAEAIAAAAWDADR